MTNSATLGSFGDASNAPLVFRNKIINGGFDIWQRGTSQTSNGYGSDDRWNNANSGSTKTASQQTFTVGQTDVPNNPRYWARTVVTSVAGASNYCLKYQSIENVATLSGQTATLSFWAKADASKNMAVEFYQGFGTGGSPSTVVSGIGVTTCALTTSWKYFTVTVSIPSISGKTLGTNNDHSLSVNFWFDAGSSFNSRTNSLGQQSGTFDIAQVQLEQGLSATPFEQRPIGMEEALCQRYYYRRKAASSADFLTVLQVYASSSAFGKFFDLPVELRSNTVVVGISSLGHIQPNSATGSTATTTVFSGTSGLSGNARSVGTLGGIYGSSGLVAGNATVIQFVNASGWIDVSAEL